MIRCLCQTSPGGLPNRWAFPSRLRSRGSTTGRSRKRWRTAPSRRVTSTAFSPSRASPGDAANLEGGGLAVVGSRQVSEDLVEYTENVGRLAALSGVPIVSGGARGIDQAAMRGALTADGRVVGVLADSLERAALHRENRAFLRERRLVLVSPYDPAAGFNVGHAMQRNKMIYSLADAALVVSSDLEKGGTWAGAIEQLEAAPHLPVYVRATGEASAGLEALQKRGALTWPEPKTPDELALALAVESPAVPHLPEQAVLPFVA